MDSASNKKAKVEGSFASQSRSASDSLGKHENGISSGRREKLLIAEQLLQHETSSPEAQMGAHIWRDINRGH